MLFSKLLKLITLLPSYVVSSLAQSNRTRPIQAPVTHILATIQPSHLHKLITVQPPRSTPSSSLVTRVRPLIVPSFTLSLLHVVNLIQVYLTAITSPCYVDSPLSSSIIPT